MLLFENIKEAFRSIKTNLLRANLTALIIAVGISALVGILTAIDSLKGNINNSFSSLGSNTLEIRNREPGSGPHIRKKGKKRKRYPSITYKEAAEFKQKFQTNAIVNLSVTVTDDATLKSQYARTNPNVTVQGTDETFLGLKQYNFRGGRNFSNLELMHGDNVCIVGAEIAAMLFPSGYAVNQQLFFFNRAYRVIGQFEPKGSTMAGTADRLVVIPIENAIKVNYDNSTSYEINIAVKDPSELEETENNALAVMRLIRKDGINQEESFSISKSDSLALALIDSIGTVSIAASLIGIITLLGAAIGLMNIMMVSVTERTREIGVRKAMGATSLLIRQQFLVEAVVICQLGGLLGILLGILFGNLASYYLGGSFIFPWVWVLAGLFVCYLVGMISGYYPAWKASRLDPIEALRYE
ncbi:MAG: hypothetical protein A3H98_10490 [Bacteroidetes bacterium RIFCSPLOWO2_02_FULL_36_8]|nr:MAG: hypothetical protein A3H98_10490 [Bacteroidetes bacterium RIFCSPLOWO2_02_FULL_36_8]OFY70932.1 MAG: hypothetical protein A3G23_12500 [Bacteroidetes bacterium RIFCSPLOWO2_12_FULL_37_12]